MAGELNPSNVKLYAETRVQLLTLLDDARTRNDQAGIARLETSLAAWPYSTSEVKAEVARLARVHTAPPEPPTVAERVRGVRGRV